MQTKLYPYMSKYHYNFPCAPNKTRTCIPDLGGLCSILWTIGAYITYLHRPVTWISFYLWIFYEVDTLILFMTYFSSFWLWLGMNGKLIWLFPIICIISIVSIIELFPPLSIIAIINIGFIWPSLLPYIICSIMRSFISMPSSAIASIIGLTPFTCILLNMLMTTLMNDWPSMKSLISFLFCM